MVSKGVAFLPTDEGEKGYYFLHAVVGWNKGDVLDMLQRPHAVIGDDNQLHIVLPLNASSFQFLRLTPSTWKKFLLHACYLSKDYSVDISSSEVQHSMLFDKVDRFASWKCVMDSHHDKHTMLLQRCVEPCGRKGTERNRALNKKAESGCMAEMVLCLLHSKV